MIFISCKEQQISLSLPTVTATQDFLPGTWKRTFNDYGHVEMTFSSISDLPNGSINGDISLSYFEFNTSSPWKISQGTFVITPDIFSNLTRLEISITYEKINGEEFTAQNDESLIKIIESLVILDAKLYRNIYERSISRIYEDSLGSWLQNEEVWRNNNKDGSGILVIDQSSEIELILQENNVALYKAQYTDYFHDDQGNQIDTEETVINQTLSWNLNMDNYSLAGDDWPGEELTYDGSFSYLVPVDNGWYKIDS